MRNTKYMTDEINYLQCSRRERCITITLHDPLTAEPAEPECSNTVPNTNTILSDPLLRKLTSLVATLTSHSQSFPPEQLYTKPRSSTLFTKLGSSEDPMVFFCNFSTAWCGRLLKLCFLGFWNHNSVIQALLASTILCLFISTEVTGGTELLHSHLSLIQHLNNVIFWALSVVHFSNLQRSEPENNKNNNIPHL